MIRSKKILMPQIIATADDCVEKSTEEQFRNPIIAVDLESGKTTGKGLDQYWEQHKERTEFNQGED